MQRHLPSCLNLQHGIIHIAGRSNWWAP